MKSISKQIGIAAIVSAIFIPLSIMLVTDFKAASVSEIQSAVKESSCAKRLLLDANRGGTEIRRRDLETVRGKCVSLSKQAEAFE